MAHNARISKQERAMQADQELRRDTRPVFRTAGYRRGPQMQAVGPTARPQAQAAYTAIKAANDAE